MEGILSKLDVYTKAWASNLTEDDVAKLLQAVYKLPGLLETLQCKPDTSEELDRFEELLDRLENVDKSDGSDRLAALDSFEKLDRSEKAANIGKCGERKFAEICQRLPGNYTLQDTSKQGKKGDFIVTYSECGVIRKCLIDIKNYSTTVPKKEIDKFMEDLAFGSYDAGLLVSYSTKFAGIAEHLYIQDECLSSGKIPIMYLVSQDESMILTAIELLIAKTIIPTQKNADIDRIESLVSTVNNSLSNSSDVRRMLSDLQSQISKSIQKCQENLVTHEAHIKRAVKELSGCVSKVMVDRIMPHVPKVETRIDNVEPISAGSQINLDTPEKADAVTKICKQDRQVFDELLTLNWDDIDYPSDSKVVCELTSKNMILRVNALKTKTSITMDFLEELEIPETEFESITHKITKDNSFVCVMDSHLIAFIKKYMSI